MELFGRDGFLDALAGSASPLTLLVGDSGTGKSSVLAEAQQQQMASGVSPAPVQVNRAPGSLQVALLDCMGAAVAQLATDEKALGRFGRLIVDAAGRVADARVKDLRAAVGRHLLGIVRAKVSPEMADLVGDFATELSESNSDALASRITAASDNEVVAEIASLAAELRELADDREVYLALDDLDRLDDDDLRRLSDLAASLPDGVRIRGSFTTWHASSRARAESLEVAGATSIALAGLSEDDVQGWLDASGLDRSLSPSVMAATNGYPVHVQDAIALLRQEPAAATLATMGPDDVTRARVKQAWRELDAHSQVAAAKLAVHVDPLSIDRVCDLLGVDELTWGAVELNLVDAGLLVGDGRRWFHELRRRAIWESVLSAPMRATALQAATAELQNQFALPSPPPETFVDMALVAAENLELQESEPSVRAAVEATSDEVAVAAALLELVEFERGTGAVDADSVLAHARDVYGLTGDAVEALERLVGRKLVHVASNERASAIVPTWGSQDAVRVIRGRAAREFGRLPVIQLGTALFESLVRPRLGQFNAVMYGIGAPSVASSAAEIAAIHREPRDGVIHLGREGPGLLIRGSHGVVPVYASVAFDTAELRDEAAPQLTGLTVDAWDETFHVQDVVSLPGGVVPSLRFARAISWLEGRPRFRLHMLQALDADHPVSVREQVEIRFKLREVLRSHCSDAERFAYQLERTTGFAFAEQDRGSTIVHCIGSDSIVELAPDVVDGPWGPYSRLRLAEAIGLGATQFAGRIEVRGGSSVKDPVTAEIVDLQKKAASLNKHQVKDVIPFDEVILTGRLRVAVELRKADGRAILAALPDVGLREPRPTVTYVILERDEPSLGWVAGAHAGLRSAVFECAPGDEAVRFAMTTAAGKDWGSRPSSEDLMRDIHGVDLEDSIWQSHEEAIGGLSMMLGFARGEARFEYAQ